MNFSFLEIGAHDWPILIKGLLMTLEISFFSLLYGLILGFALGTLRYLNIRILSPCIGFYVNTLRSIPMVLFVVALFLVAPLSPKTVAILALSMYTTASVADIIRSGLQSIDNAQLQAAQILGMSLFQRIIGIALPQATGRMLPALVNQGSVAIKDTTLVSIGVLELTKAINIINLRHLDDSIGFILLGCVFYFLLCFGISLLGAQLEKRLCKGMQAIRI